MDDVAGSDCTPLNLGIVDYAEGGAPSSALPSQDAAVSTEAISRECSASSTATLPLPSFSTAVPPSLTDAVIALVEEQKQLTHEDKVDMLARFQLLLDKPKIKLFEELYTQNIRDVANLEYQTWLNLKIQSVGTEVEAFERVLSSRMAKNVPKKKTTRKNDKPDGDERNNPLSQGYYDYFGRVEARKSKRKITPTSPPALIAGEPVKKARKTKTSVGN